MSIQTRAGLRTNSRRFIGQCPASYKTTSFDERRFSTLSARSSRARLRGGGLRRLARRAYDALSDDTSRKRYDTTGRVEQTADEELLSSFGGGKFRETLRAVEEERQNLRDALSVRQAAAGEAADHNAGFEAWLRSRGEAMGSKACSRGPPASRPILSCGCSAKRLG